eukprot:350767-Chlamydomonas_euryale.AAC.3
MVSGPAVDLLSLPSRREARPKPPRMQSTAMQTTFHNRQTSRGSLMFAQPHERRVRRRAGCACASAHLPCSDCLSSTAGWRRGQCSCRAVGNPNVHTNFRGEGAAVCAGLRVTSDRWVSMQMWEQDLQGAQSSREQLCARGCRLRATDR